MGPLSKSGLILFTLFASLFCGLDEASPVDLKPDWIDGSSLQYPEAAYLRGLGFADDKRSAERNAVEALVRVFRSSIRSKQDLAQITLAEDWFDPLSKVHYILAVLNRDKTEVVFLKNVSGLEREAEMWSERALEAEHPLAVAKALYQGLRASRQADEYQAKLRVIVPNHASPLEESVMSAGLQNQLDEVLRTHFQVEIALEGPHAAEVEKAILENLNQMGLSSGSVPKLSISGAVRFEKTGPKSPTWHFMRWSTRIILTEKESGRVIGSVRNTGREGQLSLEEVEQKSLTALQSEVNKTIKKRIFQYIFGG